jgi:hypothetical protein
MNNNPAAAMRSVEPFGVFAARGLGEMRDPRCQKYRAASASGASLGQSPLRDARDQRRPYVNVMSSERR